MTTKDILNKIDIVKIDRLDAKIIGIYPAIYIALSKLFKDEIPSVSSICKTRAAKIIVKQNKYKII